MFAYRVRMCVAKEELDVLLAHSDVAAASTPVLIFANKVRTPTQCACNLFRHLDAGHD